MLGSDQVRIFEEKAGAGEAGFGFLEFGNVEGRDVEATSLDPCARTWKRSWKNDGAAEGQGVGGVRLGRIDVNPFMAGERRGVKPRAIGEERVTAETGYGRFEMQAASDGDWNYFIVVRRKNGGKLADAFGIAALGKADKELSGDAQDVAAFKSAGKRDVFELSKLGERFGE